MVFRDLEGLVDAFLDRDRGDDDHELSEAVKLVQLEHRSQVDIGFARARLHFDREVAGGQRGRWCEPIAKLNILEIGDDLIIEQRQPVTDAEFAFDQP